MAERVPHGLLVYFASTTALTTALDYWGAHGLLPALEAAKQVCRSPKLHYICILSLENF